MCSAPPTGPTSSRSCCNGMQRKLDIFFANDRLTEEEYEKLCTQLAEKLKEQGNA